MGVSLNGLGSGLDITAIVNALMAVEALPQQQLKQAQSQQQAMITALQALNSKAASLADLARKAAAPGALNLYTATSSSEGVSAKAGTTASAGTVSLTVNQVAQTQVAVTAAMTGWPTDASGAPRALTLVDATGKQMEVTPTGASLDDVVAAINASGGPAKALKVSAGADLATGEPLYRLQLTSTTSGAAGAFSIYEGTPAEVTGGTATDLMSRTGAAVVTVAQDASATLYAGTAAEQVVTSSTNTFSNLVPGVDVTVTAAAVGAGATIAVGSDTAGISKQASDLVSSVNGLLTAIASSSNVTTTSGSSGVSSARGGLLTGNSSVRSVATSITNAAYLPTSNGRSPSELGIVIQRDGTFAFDEAKLTAALAADPSGTQATLQEIAGRVATAAREASAPASGSLTQLIAGRQSVVNDLGTRIGGWDLRLADRQTALFAIYNSMDVALGTLKSQQAWLTSQIAGLPSFNQASK